MIQKLKSNAGETITEVLVASLVVVLGVLLYTMMVQSSFRIITNSEKKMNEIYNAESKIEARESSAEKKTVAVAFSSESIASPGDVDDGNDETKVNVTIYSEGDIKAYSSALTTP